VTVLFANCSYKILQGELERVGLKNVSPTAREQFELTPPDLDWSVRYTTWARKWWQISSNRPG
jgi:hypothetical protein